MRLAAATFAMASLSLVWVGLAWPQPLAVVFGLAGLVVGGAMWRGSSAARVVAVAMAPLGIPPALFGAWGLTVVAADWSMCADRRLAMLATSYPPNFCEMVDWVTRWGIGLGLAGLGVAGILVLALLTLRPGIEPERHERA